MDDVIYFANPSTVPIREAMTAGHIGCIDTPLQGNKRPAAVWCADNGCFNDARFDENYWWQWLVANSGQAHTCRFATAPDVVGDHEATLNRSMPWLARIRALGYPAAFVGQDGAQVETMPWDDFDVLFIGGTTDWKLGPIPRQLAGEAKRRGKWVHMGRVNSLKRYRYAEAIGCDSADGTKLVFGPDQNLPIVLDWVDDLRIQPAMFGVEA